MTTSELENLQYEYITYSQKVLQTLIEEVKVKSKLQDQVKQLEIKNVKLNERIIALEKQLVQQKEIQEEVRELEDYEEVVERCMQAYVDDRHKVTLRCCKEIVRYKKYFQIHMTEQDFWSILFIAFIDGYDDVFYPAYECIGVKENIEEYRVYQLLKNIREGKYRAIGDITGNLKLDRVNCFVRAEIIDYIVEYIEAEEIRQFKLENIWMIDEEEYHEVDELVKQINEYFTTERHELLREKYEHLMKRSSYYNSKLSLAQINQLLCIGYIYGYDDKLIETYKCAKEFVNGKDNNRFYKLLQQDYRTKEYGVVKQCISTYIKERKNHGEYGISKESLKIIKRRVKEVCIPKADRVVVNLISPTYCCTKELIVKNVWISTNSQNKQVIKVKALYCEECSTVYISHEKFREINGNLAPHKFIIPTNSGKSLVHKGTSSNNKDLKNKSTTDISSNLNETSALKRLGYDTTRGREERWKILKNEAVPELGYDKVVYYLKMFIRMHESKPQMRNVVSEWKYDLKRLENF